MVKKIIIGGIIFLLINFFSVNALDTAHSSIVMDLDTGKVLYKNDINSKRLIASITKILTAMVTIENSDINKEITVGEEVLKMYGTNIYIEVGEKMTIKDLLYGLLLRSGNDASVVLAKAVGKSEENFVKMMNAKAKEIGMKSSTFQNPHGLDEETKNYSTAYDIALLMKYCVSNTTFQKYASLKSCEIPATNLSDIRKYSNTNPMLNPDSQYYYQSLLATKTGFTTPAKYCLASYAKENDLSMICVILHSEESLNRFNETKQLFQYAAKSFSFQDIAKKGDIITQITVQDATSDTQNLDIILNDNLNVLARSDLDSLSPQITLKNIPSAPVSKGEIVGTATYTIDEQNYSIDLVAANDVIKKSSHIYFIIALLCVLVILLLLCFVKIKRKK